MPHENERIIGIEEDGRRVFSKEPLSSFCSYTLRIFTAEEIERIMSIKEGDVAEIQRVLSTYY